MNPTKPSSRRDFLKTLGLGLASLPFFGTVAGSFASRAFAGAAPAKVKEIPLPAGEKAVNPKEPLPIGLGYVDGGTPDLKRYPQFKAGQNCKGCAFYTAANEGWGKCQILQPGVVKATGWCSSFQPKPKA